MHFVLYILEDGIWVFGSEYLPRSIGFQINFLLMENISPCNWIFCVLSFLTSDTQLIVKQWINIQLIYNSSWISHSRLYQLLGYIFFIQENAFENVVWKMAAIFSRLQWVKTMHTMTSCALEICCQFTVCHILYLTLPDTLFFTLIRSYLVKQLLIISWTLFAYHSSNSLFIWIVNYYTTDSRYI